jgi:hypothetical protein
MFCSRGVDGLTGLIRCVSGQFFLEQIIWYILFPSKATTRAQKLFSPCPWLKKSDFQLDKQLTPTPSDPKASLANTGALKLTLFLSI